MNTKNINNVLLLSLIVSFVLHFSLFNTDVSGITEHQNINFHSLDDVIQIPIEFIPNTETVATRQYTIDDINAVKKLLSEAADSHTQTKPLINSTAAYSLNRTRTALNQYLLAVREDIEKNKFNLAPITYANIVGNVKIRFSISAEGIFSNIRLVESSGDQNLDKSALLAVNSASGKSKRSKNTGTKTIKTSVVVKYQYGL